MKIKQIHTVLEFDQTPWLKSYIDFNTQKRMEAATEFEKTFYKFLNCSVFGKLMECQRKHLEISLTNSERKFNKLTSRPTFKECRIFNDSLVGVHNKRSKVLINKPIYAGQTVLDLSKLLMYQFWYRCIKANYGNQCSLLMTDTDSLLFYVETDDVYGDMKRNATFFDFSEYPQNHDLYSQANRKVPGKFKDEVPFPSIVKSYCGLRSKMYAIKIYNENKHEVDRKKAKGIQKATIERDLRFDMYEKTLRDKTEIASSMDLIRSRLHNIYCETVVKKSLSSFDDKRYLLQDGTSSLAYGHYYIA